MSKKDLYKTCKVATISLICKEKHYISLLNCQWGNCWATFLSSSNLDSTTFVLAEIFYQLPSYHCHLHFSILFQQSWTIPSPFSVLFCCCEAHHHFAHLLSFGSCFLGPRVSWHIPLLSSSTDLYLTGLWDLNRI